MDFKAPDLRAVEAFLYEEVRLLDDREFEKWSDLFTDDGIYWVPAKPDQKDPYDHVSLFFDDKEIRETRIKRLRHPKIHVQIPHSRTIHLVSNVTILEKGLAPADFVTRSNFIMMEDRLGDERRIYGGRYTHHLRVVDGAVRMIQKRVDLTDCDGIYPALTLPF